MCSRAGRAQHRGFNDVAEQIYPALVGNLQGTGWAIKSLEFSGHSLGGALAVLIAMYGNFDIIWDHFSRVSQLHPTPHAPCDMLYLVLMLIVC